MGAAQNGCFEIVELLLQQKDIKINEVNNNGESAIMLANSNQGGNENCKNIVELLKKQNDIIYDEKLLASETKQAHQVFGGWGAPKPKFAEANPAFLLEQDFCKFAFNE